MTAPPPLPVTVLTGFLGAGKTTLLNRTLRDPALGGSLVLVNEFGEIGLDHLLIETVGEDMLLLSSGCLCCTIRGELSAALEGVLRRQDSGGAPPIRRVIIETTGLADPVPILQTLTRHPYLSRRFALDVVATVVDAVNGDETLDAHPEALRQAALADRIALSKTDLAPPGRATAMRARLATLNPSASIRAAEEADGAWLTGAGLWDADGKIADVGAWLNDAALPHVPAEGGHDHDHDHDHAHDHGHDVNRHDARIRAFCLTADQPAPAGALDLFLQLLRAAHGPKLLRVKGLVNVAESPGRPVLIQGARHVLHDPVWLDAWPDADRRTRVVFITQDLEPDFVARLWAAFNQPAAA